MLWISTKVACASSRYMQVILHGVLGWADPVVLTPYLCVILGWWIPANGCDVVRGWWCSCWWKMYGRLLLCLCGYSGDVTVICVSSRQLSISECKSICCELELLMDAIIIDVCKLHQESRSIRIVYCVYTLEECYIWTFVLYEIVPEHFM